MGLIALARRVAGWDEAPDAPKPAYIPADYGMIATARDADDLFARRFSRARNGVLLPRPRLSGDFNALAVHLEKKFVTQYETGRPPEIGLAELRWAMKGLDEKTRLAARSIEQDFLGVAGRNGVHWVPALRIVTARAYGQGIYGFHADTAVDDEDIGEGRLMCWYNGPAVRILRGDRARRDPGGPPGCYLGPRHASDVFSPAPFDMLRVAFRGAPGDGLIHAAPEIADDAAPRVGMVADVLENALRTP